MQIFGREYQTAKPEEVSTYWAKKLVNLSTTYDDFVAATEEKVEEEKYKALKILWTKVVEALVKDADDKLKNFDNIPVAVYTEVIKSFFPSPSEVKK
jgi:hypothetical protein